MANGGLVVDGNTGGMPADSGGEPGTVLLLALVARLWPVVATLRRGR